MLRGQANRTVEFSRVRQKPRWLSPCVSTRSWYREPFSSASRGLWWASDGLRLAYASDVMLYVESSEKPTSMFDGGVKDLGEPAWKSVPVNTLELLKANGVFAN